MKSRNHFDELSVLLISYQLSVFTYRYQFLLIRYQSSPITYKKMHCHEINDFEIDDEISIELTPLIDVIFMLLIFFIVATTFAKPAFDVLLPDAESAKLVDEKEKTPVCTITIDAAGTIFFDGVETPHAALATALQENAGKIFEVFSDKTAPFGSVMNLMDEAKKQGNENLLFMVEKND